MDEETLTVWLDTALLMLGGFVLMTTLMMTVMNPPAKASETDGVTAPGNVTVETQWPDKLDADVDLWVQAPGDVPVGYSNKSGKVFDLLRDDLGMAQDMTDSNHEVAYSRGAPAGEYVINVHMYRGVNVTYAVPVKITVNVKTDSTKSSTPLATTTVQLRKPNQELTALRFRLDPTGQLVPGSINSIFKPLRVAASQ
ncbi:hypothetical protein [Mesorhizobium sp. M0408]|uniref:hypothetical protein n=1 Tax=Mesorhizobium sp. M0408 TaxID=2956942 RepID=UPI00333B6E2F